MAGALWTRVASAAEASGCLVARGLQNRWTGTPARPRRRRSSPSPSCELTPSQLTDGCQTVSMYRSNPVPARAPDRAGPLAGSTHANGAGEAGLQNAIHGLNGDAV